MIDYITGDGANLSGILYEVYGFVNAELLRDTLELNPHLTELDLVYPSNTEIKLQDPDDVIQETETQLEKLWD